MRFKKDSVEPFNRKALNFKIYNNKVALRQVVTKKVSFQIRKKENLENTPKFPSIEI